MQTTVDRLTLRNIREQIVGIDTQVPLLDGSHRQYVNLDNAASTPALRPVADKVNEFMGWYSSVHRGTGFKSQIATHVYEEAHQVVSAFFGANPDTHIVIFGKNSTEALNKLAHRLPFGPDDVVLTSQMEHHSNLLPWRKVAKVDHVVLNPDGSLDEAHLDALLQKYAGHVRLVAISGASNVTGVVNPIHRIAAKAHAAGAEILVDAAQLAPHRAINMRDIDDPERIDYLALSAHKMYAPFGTGALIGRKDIFLEGEPDLVGGGTVNTVGLDSVDWTALPDKEEAGSPNVIGAVALAKTILCLQEIGMDAIAEHEQHLTTYLLGKLPSVRNIKIYGISDPARTADRVGVIPFTVGTLNHNLVAAILSAEGGIGVRGGTFCAQPYLQHLLNSSDVAVGSGANCDDLPGLVRVSFGCYNDEAEIDWLIEILQKVGRGEYRGRYAADPVSGSLRPRGFSPDLAAYFHLH